MTPFTGSRYDASVLMRLPPASLLVSGLLCAALLAACAPKVSLESVFIGAEETGLTAQTMSGILLLQRRLERTPDDPQAPFALAQAYLQGIRENADTGLYARAEKMLDYAAARDQAGPEADFIRGQIRMGRHDFAGALPLGEKLTREHPAVQRYHGLLADAQVELGMYAQAKETLQAMADIDPDESALTRIAYFREIHGDPEGAREAMEQSVLQGGSEENLAWKLTDLARLTLASDPARADALYARALEIYPRYAPALAGRARAAMALSRPEDAERLAREAVKLLPLPEYPALLGDILAARGSADRAQAQYAIVILGYRAIAKTGTNVDLEIARFLAERGLQAESAVGLARFVHEERPTIFAADALAWALHQAGKDAEAKEYAERALATGSRDPLLLFHAGMIAKASGDAAEAKKHLEAAKNEGPHFSFLHRKELDEALAQLKPR